MVGGLRLQLKKSNDKWIIFFTTIVFSMIYIYINNLKRDIQTIKLSLTIQIMNDKMINWLINIGYYRKQQLESWLLLFHSIKLGTDKALNSYC